MAFAIDKELLKPLTKNIHGILGSFRILFPLLAVQTGRSELFYLFWAESSSQSGCSVKLYSLYPRLFFRTWLDKSPRNTFQALSWLFSTGCCASDLLRSPPAAIFLWLSTFVIPKTGLAWQTQAGLSSPQKRGKTWLWFNFSGRIAANSYSVCAVKSCQMTICPVWTTAAASCASHLSPRGAAPYTVTERPAMVSPERWQRCLLRPVMSLSYSFWSSASSSHYLTPAVATSWTLCYKGSNF